MLSAHVIFGVACIMWKYFVFFKHLAMYNIRQRPPKIFTQIHSIKPYDFHTKITKTQRNEYINMFDEDYTRISYMYLNILLTYTFYSWLARVLDYPNTQNDKPTLAVKLRPNYSRIFFWPSFQTTLKCIANHMWVCMMHTNIRTQRSRLPLWVAIWINHTDAQKQRSSIYIIRRVLCSVKVKKFHTGMLSMWCGGNRGRKVLYIHSHVYSHTITIRKAHSYDIFSAKREKVSRCYRR